MRSWQERVGFIQRPEYSDVGSDRHVVVGDTRFTMGTSHTFHDFLRDFAVTKLNREWLLANGRTHPVSVHPLAEWYERVLECEKTMQRDSNGIFWYDADGITNSFTMFAFDLYVLASNDVLQGKLIKRLRNNSNFQGARAEVIAASVMMRAGFTLELHDETDGSSKHPEFLAKDRFSDAAVEVEVKSIHRKSVLGSMLGKDVAEIGAITAGQVAAQIRRLLTNAKAKTDSKPLCVFVDVNLPNPVHRSIQQELIAETDRVRRQIDHGFDSNGYFEGHRINAVIITNVSNYYAEPGRLNGPTAFFTLFARPERCLHPSPDLSIERIERAMRQHGDIPATFSETRDGSCFRGSLRWAAQSPYSVQLSGPDRRLPTAHPNPHSK